MTYSVVILVAVAFLAVHDSGGSFDLAVLDCCSATNEPLFGHLLHSLSKDEFAEGAVYHSWFTRELANDVVRVLDHDVARVHVSTRQRSGDVFVNLIDDHHRIVVAS